MPNILLITPPMVQINAPYPATACLAGELRTRGIEARQADISIALAERIFSSGGLAEIAKRLRERNEGGRDAARPSRSQAVRMFLEHEAEYIATVDAARSFLQGRDPTLARRIATRAFLPEGPYCASLDALDVDGLFGANGVRDYALHIASLYIDDLTAVVRDGIDARFNLASHGGRIATDPPTYALLKAWLDAPPTLLDEWIDELADEEFSRGAPDVVGITVPFPGAFYGALRIARRAKRRTSAKVVIGGGYPSTELRSLSDGRVFEWFDYLALDSGAQPILDVISSNPPASGTIITAACAVSGARGSVPCDRFIVPAYEDLPLDHYIAMDETANPMTRLWSDACWLKVTIAHGCHWHRCMFCDTSLEYIANYIPPDIPSVVDGLEEIVARTGRRGFHFTDEALPPQLLRQFCEEILSRGLAIAWWGNIRFEAGLSRGLLELMAASGCVALTGGLECAQDRLLKLMNKGVRMDVARRVCRDAANAGILVHAYLMYGFPTQTEAEAMEAMASVRAMFAEGSLHSAYWHRFALTVHSPIYRECGKFGIKPRPFAEDALTRNEVAFDEPGAPDWDRIGADLRAETEALMAAVR